MESQGQKNHSSASQVALHVCQPCGSEMVHPIEWAEASPQMWNVTLRCPNCLRERSGVWSQDAVDHFDAVLDDGFAELVEELRQLSAANMADEIERFVAALHAGAVLPEDF
jgi:hypothetical protein